jgi:hypothetical protein
VPVVAFGSKGMYAGNPATRKFSDPADDTMLRAAGRSRWWSGRLKNWRTFIEMYDPRPRELNDMAGEGRTFEDLRCIARLEKLRVRLSAGRHVACWCIA